MNRTLFPFFLLFLFCRAEPLVADTAPVHRRWAVLGDAALRASGVTDLLTERLSNTAELEVVEREQIDAVLKELNLAATMGSEGAKERLALGRILRADALVLLAVQQRAEKNFMQFIVCDCAYGARLHVVYHPMEDQDAEDLARWCAAELQTVRKQFASGIERIVGVTQFMSKNLTHDFDYFQFGATGLVESALLAQPGVAVLEFEEVRAISRELALSGKELQRQTEPLLVEGEFRTHGQGTQAKIDLLVRVKSGKRSDQEFSQQGISLEEAQQWLQREIPRALLKTAADAPQLSRESQRKALAARAEMFAALGDWRAANRLREAALLLEPNDFPQRLTIINEYCRWQLLADVEKKQSLKTFSRQSKLSASEARQAWRKEYLPGHVQLKSLIWGGLASHVEIAVASRTLNPREAAVLIDRVLASPNDLIDSQLANIPEVRRERLQFYWATYPKLLELDATIGRGTVREELILTTDPVYGDRPFTQPEDAARQTLFWKRSALRDLERIHKLGTATLRAEFPLPLPPKFKLAPLDSKAFLADFERFIATFAADAPWSHAVSSTMCFKVPLTTHNGNQGLLIELLIDKHLSKEEVQGLYSKLAASPKPRLAFYGRFGELMLDCMDDAQTKSNKAELLPRLNELSAICSADRTGDWVMLASAMHERSYPYDPKPFNPDGKRPVIIPETARPTTPLRPLDPTSPWWEADSPAPRPPASELARHLIKPVTTLERVSLENIAELKPLKPKPDTVVFACGPKLDLWWHNSHPLHVMHSKGQLQKLFEPTQTSGRQLAAAFDGENFWIGCDGGSIFVVSPQGDPLAEIGSKEGLPPFGIGRHAKDFSNFRHEQLQPLGPGKCVAIGVFGPQERVWAAVIECKKQSNGSEKYEVNLFYQATRVQPSDRTDPANSDANIICHVGRVSRYVAPNGERLLFVERRLKADNDNLQRPLVMDVTDEPAVKIADSPPPWLPSLTLNSAPIGVEDGRVVASTDGLSLSVFTPDKSLNKWKQEVLVPKPADWGKAPWPASAHVSGSLVAHDRYIYFAGPQWHRIDRQTLAVEQLSSQPVASGVRQFHASVHYGVMGMSRWQAVSRGWRLVLDGPVSGDGLKATYTWVAADRQAAHHQAVTEIMRLGGHVGQTQLWTRGGSDQLERENSVQSMTSTVLLGPQWKGRDDGLKLLQGLFEVKRVYLIDAPITDAGMAHLAELGTLQTLYISGCPLTAAGMRHLEIKPPIALHLEAAPGAAAPGDNCLEVVATFQAMRNLGLVGKGFTDGGVARLQNREKHLSLGLRDTSVTSDFAAKIDIKKLPIRGFPTNRSK